MAIRRFIAPAVSGLVVIAVAGAAGYFPTRRFAGQEGLVAMLAGCGVGLLTNWIGLAVFGAMASDDRRGVPKALLLSTGTRFLAVLILALAAALSGRFAQAPLLIWVALSYLVGLAAETVWLVRWGQDFPGK